MSIHEMNINKETNNININKQIIFVTSLNFDFIGGTSLLYCTSLSCSKMYYQQWKADRPTYPLHKVQGTQVEILKWLKCIELTKSSNISERFKTFHDIEYYTYIY